jgi:hypothetical protein
MRMAHLACWLFWLLWMVQAWIFWAQTGRSVVREWRILAHASLVLVG